MSALPIGTSWWELIQARAELTPDREFIADEFGNALTYSQYKESAESVAAGLKDLGVKSSQVVSWQLSSTLGAAVLMAALCRLGVRQNPIIPILRRNEVSLITRQVGSEWLFVPGIYRDFDFVEMAESAVDRDKCKIVNTSDFAHNGFLSLPTGDPVTLDPVIDPRDDIRWYFYSSGTTAVAKGARHTDASVMASSNAQIAYLQLQESDAFCMPFPITHVGGMMLLTGYARIGARLFFIETFDPIATPLVMSERGVTNFGSATPFFQAYLAAQEKHGPEPLFPKMRQLQAGGAPITPELNAECIRVFGQPILNQWGLTEFPSATSLSPSDPIEKFNGSVGRLAPGVEAKTRDFDGNETAVGAEGELWLRGPQQCKGYVDETLNADAFDSDGYFRTGDLGYIDQDGFVFITGRLKDIIIRNAENISALEIESVLIEHPKIADVAVVGVPDPQTGERACAVVVLTPEAKSITIKEIADHCGSRGLAKQKFPERLEIVSELPRNPMGKVLKHVLRSQISR